jgi:hypothetical protein
MTRHIHRVFSKVLLQLSWIAAKDFDDSWEYSVYKQPNDWGRRMTDDESH